MQRLKRDFFERSTLQVAQELLGKIIIFGKHKLIINETEAYIGRNDPACHASRGITKRTEVMFGPGGFSYVYFIYGMYHCLNFVTEVEGTPAAVLIRGAKLIGEEEINLNGPGKLCRFLDITKDRHNKIDIVTSKTFFTADAGLTLPFKKTPRIGIKVATDKLWRFIAS